MKRAISILEASKKEEAEKAKEASHALFAGNGGDDSNMPTTELTGEQLTDGKIGMLDVMVACQLTASKGEARRLITQGGVSVDGEKIAVDAFLTVEQLKDGVKIKKGKKVYHRVLIK